MMYLYRSAHRLLVLIIAATLLLVSQSHALAQGPIRIIWLHHSVGFGIIDGGGVREGLTALGYEFYDHGYNDDGLRLADGSSTGTNFNVPDDNTYPDGLAAIFSQPLNNPPNNTFSYLMQYDVIMLKSCFPTSNISDDAQLEADKDYYRTIVGQMDKYPDKILIIVTHPPQVPLSTNADEARRARALNDWLLSDEFQSGHSNLYVFDLFGPLADGEDLLRSEYRVSDDDAHPNDIANAAIGPELVDFVDQASRGMAGGAPPPVTTADNTQPTEPPADQPQAAPPDAGNIVDDFEAGVDAWHGESDRPETTVECGTDGELVHGGAASLRLNFDIATGGWINCGKSFDELQSWGGATGLSLWVRADKADQWITLGIYSGSPEAATPFEVFFAVPAESLNAWSQVSFPWSTFKRAEWADASGLSEIDPAQVIGYSLSLGSGEETNKGSVWVDDVELSGGSVAAVPTKATEPDETEPDQTEQAGQQASKGLCGGAGAILLLPLAAGIVIADRRRHKGIR